MRTMERLLLAWIEDCDQKSIPVSAMAIKTKAKTLYQKVKDKQKDKTETEDNEKFHASNGWLARFKSRTGLDNFQDGAGKCTHHADYEAASRFPREVKVLTSTYY